MAGAFNDSTAIVGIGWTAFSRHFGTSVLNLAAEASLNAIRDAGLTPHDIDGLISYRFFDDTVSPTELAQALGSVDVGFQSFDTLGGVGAARPCCSGQWPYTRASVAMCWCIGR